MSDIADVYPTQRVVTCDVCGGVDSVKWYCKNCPGSLCCSCKATHKTTAISSKRSVVPRTQTVVRTHGPVKIAEQCHRHVGKDVVIYCMKCKVPCCAKCLAEKHQRHDVCPIEEAYLDKENELNTYIKNMEDNEQKQLDTLINEAKDDDTERKTATKKAIDDVNKFRKKMKKAGDVQCDSYVDILEKPNDYNDNFIADIQKQKQNVDKVIRACKEKIWEGKLDLIEYTPVSPSSLVPNNTRTPTPKPEFLPDKGVLEAIRKGIGKIDLEGEGKNVMYTADKAPALKFDKSSLQMQQFRTIQCKIDVTSVAMAGKGTAWIADSGEDNMYLLDGTDEAVLRSVRVKKGVDINDVVVTPSGEIIVANNDNKVRAVSVGGSVQTLINTPPFEVVGVCLSETSQIIVCLTGQEEQNHLAVYTSDGKTKVSELYGSNRSSKHMITNPYRVVRNETNYCVVNYNSDVVAVDESGSIKWVYDGSQAGLGKSFDPTGICCDKYSNILVSDFQNRCVHYIDREGQLIQIMLTEEHVGLIQHWGIGVDDQTGEVWVGNSKKSLLIAKYLK